jgi:hypothetical protein
LKKEGKMGKQDEAGQSAAGSTSVKSADLRALEQMARAKEKSGLSSSVARQYQERIRSKLSKKQSDSDSEESESRRMGLEEDNDEDDEVDNSILVRTDDDDDEDTAVSLDLITKTMAEKSMQDAAVGRATTEATTTMITSGNSTSTTTVAATTDNNTDTVKQTTSGVGGAWSKSSSEEEVETYKPSRGSWGAFPRPKDISKAYGGGRRVGAGFSSEEQYELSVESTRDRLQKYRERVGIVVQSEIDHKDEIEEALAISGRAMLVSVCAM